jgi:hypothetical protein
MVSVFFLFLPRNAPPRHNDWMFSLVKRYVRWSVRRPFVMLGISLPLLVVLTAIAVSPKPALIFDASTRSMEPKSSDAGHALHTIMAKMPTRWEPAIAIVQSADAQQQHDYWQQVSAHWSTLQEQGKIKSFATPAALALSPRRLDENREKLRGFDFARAGRRSTLR